MNSIKFQFTCLTCGLGLLCALPVPGQLITIEPDNYATGTVLDHIVPQVSLTTAGTNNQPIPPVPFNVTSQPTPPGFASTGTKVFAEAGVNFFNDNVRMRMNFNGLVQSVSLDAIGSGFTLLPERGHLEVYNSQNVLLDSSVTGILGSAQIQAMSLSHSSPDIAWAVAWSEGGTFARLDNLAFSTPVLVPEPSVTVLISAGLLLGVASGWRQKWKGLSNRF